MTDLLKIVAHSMLVLFAIFCLYSAFYKMFFTIFLKGYVWSELLINYEGGFVRRGLLGEIVFLLHQHIPIKACFFVFIGIPYIVFCVLVFIFFRYIPLHWQFYYIFCPALFSFWIWDGQSFGRKEIYGVILYVFLILISLNKKYIDYFKKKPILFYAGLILSLLFVSLVHELTVFFIPFFALVANKIYFKKTDRKFITLNLLLLASVPTIIFTLGFLLEKKPTARALVENSWMEMFSLNRPGITRALDFLYLGMSEGIKISFRIFSTYPTNLYYLGLFLLMALPMLVFIWFRRKLIWQYLKQHNLMLINCSLCLSIPFTLFFVGMDYGRWINQILTYTFFGLSFVVISATRSEAATTKNKVDENNKNLFFTPIAEIILTCLFLIIFTMVGMKHYTGPGDSPVITFGGSPYYKQYAKTKYYIDNFFVYHPSLLRFFVLKK